MGLDDFRNLRKSIRAIEYFSFLSVPSRFEAAPDKRSSAADPRTLRVSRRVALVGSGWKAGRERGACVWKKEGKLDNRDNVLGSGWEAEREEIM